MPTLIEDFCSLRERRDQIRACGAGVLKAPDPNLRDFIEADAAWWPAEIICDGADHVVLPRSAEERKR